MILWKSKGSTGSYITSRVITSCLPSPDSENANHNKTDTCSKGQVQNFTVKWSVRWNSSDELSCIKSTWVSESVFRLNNVYLNMRFSKSLSKSLLINKFIQVYLKLGKTFIQTCNPSIYFLIFLIFFLFERIRISLNYIICIIFSYIGCMLYSR